MSEVGVLKSTFYKFIHDHEKNYTLICFPPNFSVTKKNYCIKEVYVEMTIKNNYP